MYTGPKLINDNLVFGYDTGYAVADNVTPTRFYKGAPTTNPIHGQNAVAQNSYTTWSATSSGNWNANHPKAIRAYNASGGEITGYYNSGVGSAENTHHAHWQLDPILKKPVVVMNDRGDAHWKAKSYGTGLGTWTSQGKTYGDTYTISWLQWVDDLSKNARTGLYTQSTSGSNGFHDGQSTSASSYNTKLRTWQRVYQTYTTANSRNLNHSMASIYMYGHYSPRAVVKVADVQWQWGSTPFPFSETSERSSTASLIDLKGTADIDLSNVSFDSTGQPTFDGTDDWLNVPVTLNSGDFTYETVMKQPSSASNVIFTAGTGDPSGGGTYIQAYVNSSGGKVNLYAPVGASGWQSGTYDNTGNFTSTANTWYHIVVANFGTTWKIYVNGNLVGDIDSFKPNVGNKVGVARDAMQAENSVSSQVSLVKIYNTALSIEKVQQNYKAYKSRFNI